MISSSRSSPSLQLERLMLISLRCLSVVAQRHLYQELDGGTEGDVITLCVLFFGLSSPVVITIDSQSSPDDDGGGGHGNRLPVFSDLAVRQPIDLSACALPALRLVEPGGVGVGLGADVGELPVNILARGSDCSDTEANDQSKCSEVLAVDISDDDDEREGERGAGC